MTSEDIISKIRLLKASKDKIFTNSTIFFQKYPCKNWNVLESEKSLIVVINEQEIKRIIFYTLDFKDLKKMLQNINGNIVIEVVSKNKENMRREIEELGFEHLVTQVRVSSKDISNIFSFNSPIMKYYNDSIGIIAVNSDMEQINKILWNTFDTRSSHLKSKKELIEQIEKGEFYIYKNTDKEIEMLIQYSASPKSFYFNQVINKGDKEIFHALTLNILKKYYEQGGKYAYAWVNEGNIASFRYFRKYTLVEDGVYNDVYFMNGRR